MPEDTPLPPALGLAGIARTIANLSAVVILAVLLLWLVMFEAPRLHDKFADELNRTREHEEVLNGKLVEAVNSSTKATTDLTIEMKTTRRQHTVDYPAAKAKE